ncbi:hypothetical protein C3747_234g49 [Trypanosoma cruzi]|uniref:Trypanosoma Tc-38 (p38) protein domain-containing protein n=2 Tax=Trypanosoma cruzi TaxID=5693 RepID=A0A2V2VP44_TRYCR|nr:hypothetical protein ECC02_004023 [Trypanosoma cruzi]KAF8301771.1 hypothetical protein TcYC6_0050620 [Trypanosoma cruzi]PWU98209.1 hypothetical protein C3747_234g49 [Trypanosoma cruzi]
MKGLCWVTRVLLKRKTPSTVSNEVSVLSSVTNAPFSSSCQAILRAVARTRHYVKRYWVTLPQSRRTCNAVVLPGESPTVIHLNVEKVLPFTTLPKKIQKRIMDEHPPFFGSGVGILSTRMKWKAVTAERLIRLLNEDEEDRALYIDVAIADQLGVKVNAKDAIDIRKQSSISVYNAEQLDDPYKGEPQKGVALNAMTGKRLGQPAHDILLAVGIMRGYTSPMWVAEKQLKHLNLEVRESRKGEGVLAPNMTGLIVSLSQLPKDAQQMLLKELRENHSDAFGFDLYFLYNVNGWEVMRSRVLVKHMAAVNDSQYPYHFVNLRDFGLQNVKFADFAGECQRKLKPLGPEVLVTETTQDDKADENNNEGRGGLALQIAHFSRGRGSKGKGVSTKVFFAEDATLRRYYNAVCLSEPHLAVPAVRSVAILNGKLIGRRDEAKLRSFALKHKLSSPIWVTPIGARRMGVGIEKKHLNKFVAIGAGAVEDQGDDVVEEFYNLDDFADPNEILSIFPKKSKSAHFLLDSKWRPVLGKQRQAYLTSLRRSTPLWISVNECLMSGFEPKPESQSFSFPSEKKSTGSSGGIKLYNSQLTTDPVRVIGLATVYTRPQGHTL